MSQEGKDARKAVGDAENAALTQRIKMLQEDEKYTQVAAKYAAAREEYLKTKKKEDCRSQRIRQSLGGIEEGCVSRI